MKKLHEALGKSLIAGDKVGIEIEAEGDNIKFTNLVNWKSEDDGSLRGVFPNSRHEFVSGVLDIKDVEKEIENLAKEQKDAKFDFSFRTSTHVHINVLDMPVVNLVNFIYLYYLLEKDLLKYCGPSRENNRFCLRVVDSEFQVEILKLIIQNDFREIRYIISDELRYAACNMASLLKYGTLEFRGMRGTIDKAVLCNWINMLIRLKNLALGYPAPLSIYQQALENPNKFLDMVYGEYAGVFRNEGSYTNLTEALSLTVEIPFVSKEWMDRYQDHPKPARAAKSVYAPLFDHALRARVAEVIPHMPVIIDDINQGF